MQSEFKGFAQIFIFILIPLSNILLQIYLSTKAFMLRHKMALNVENIVKCLAKNNYFRVLKGITEKKIR